MAKRLFLLVLICLIEVIATPNILTAADSFLVGMPELNDAETIIVQDVIEEAESEAPAVVIPVVASEPEPVIPSNYTVTIYSGEVLAHGLSYGDIYKTEKLIYGHNTWNLLGSLANRSVGEVFTITEGGVARNYQVANIVLYEKDANGYLNGDKTLMGRLTRSAFGHDVALMTCAGTSYGNGDASHRLVVFADAV